MAEGQQVCIREKKISKHVELKKKKNTPLAGDAVYRQSTHKHTHIHKLIAQLDMHRHK
jgi:hypothetical protein